MQTLTHLCSPLTKNGHEKYQSPSAPNRHRNIISSGGAPRLQHASTRQTRRISNTLHLKRRSILIASVIHALSQGRSSPNELSSKNTHSQNYV